MTQRVAGNRGSRTPDGAYERAELRAGLPGEHGFECIFYQYIARATAHLRERVYITVVAEGEEFRPANSFLGEHFPVEELIAYQTEAGRLAGTGEEAFGKGRTLEVAFACYAPPGSAGAAEAVEIIAEALEELREVATWQDGKRTMFGLRHGLGRTAGMVGTGTAPSYRPPEGVLSHRPHAPKPTPRATPSFATQEQPPLPDLDEIVRNRLARWGLLEDAERYGFVPKRSKA